MVIKNIMMKKILILLFLICSLTASADKWYVATAGSDSHGKGTLADPWLTLHHATDTITGASFAGDTIALGAGTFTETEQSICDENVSLIGVVAFPLTSIITTATVLNPIILMSSAAQGTDGNQSISYLKIDGDLTAKSLIKIFARSNVDIHHCEFVDAAYQGVMFFGRADSLYQMTTTYSTGNSFHDNIVTNCAAWDAATAWDKPRGNFCFGGTDGMLIYNNTIIQPDRGGAANGDGIKFTNHGNHKGTKIYDNTITVPQKKAETSGGGGYNFALELWSQRGGIELMRNTINGCIDIGGYDTNDEGGYGYALKIYDNTIGYDALSAYNHNGIGLELGIHGGTYIYNNWIKNLSRPITLSTTGSALVQGQEDIYVYYNVFQNVRLSSDGWYGYCFDINPAVETTIHNLQILNNTVYAVAERMFAFIESNDATTTFTDIVVRNNIVSNAHACVAITNGTVTGINVDNNDFYNTSHQTDYTGATVTGNTLANNITGDPLFVSVNGNFHLQVSSPCISAGFNVGLTTDYDGHHLTGALWDIGAYEYGQAYLKNNGNLEMNSGKIIVITR